ncbi:MAG: transporter substrate-binding domain-containing protein [Candidatus Accumulibacter sp.]|jgi:signal transduction histidine kinase/CheY-like chemotaxis protein|nr:transporter substrate-binding domain-containing protein [Accumulibacter sp.]
MPAKIRIYLMVSLLAAVLGGILGFVWTRNGIEGTRPDDASGAYAPISFRAIPNITEAEIQAVNQAIAGRTSFTYGMMKSSECFYQDDGSVDGYATLIAKWLSDFFGVPFQVKIYSWNDLVKGIKSGEIDFTSDFTPPGARPRGFSMTRPARERPVKIATRAFGPSLDEIVRERPLNIAFLRDSGDKALVIPHLEEKYGKTLSIVELDSVDEAAGRLRRKEADLFVGNDAWLEIFHDQKDIAVSTFLPLLYQRISVTTGNLELAPLIAAINKSFSNETLSYLHNLYREGITRFYRKTFVDNLNEAERDYYEEHIRAGLPIPVGASPTNYPIEFYNEKENHWSGVAFDILAEISSITGLSFKPVVFDKDNWPLLLRMLRSGDPDAPMVLDMSYNEYRRREFLLADQPYLKDYYALISLNSLRNLRHNEVLFHRIGLLQDTAYTHVFQQWFPSHASTKQFDSQLNEFNALETGEIDLMMLSQFHFSYITNYLKKTNFKINLVFEDPLSTGFGFNKEQKELRGIISKAQALVDTQSIVRRWEYSVFDFRREASRTQIVFLISTCVFMSLFILLLAMLLMQRHREGVRLKADVAERTRELAEQVKATEAASEAKGRFLATMSHEIRTPLNAIIGISELMLNEKDQDERNSRSLENIHRAGHVMLSIVNDILDISKIESGKFELFPSEYETPSQISDIASMNITRKGDKDIHFSLVLDETLPRTLYGDELRVKQIFNNLLSNAFKYTQKGVVEWKLSWEREGRNVWLCSSIRDSGIGIRPEDTGKLFTSYNQLDGKANRNIEGTGLGLALVKRLVDLMDGTVGVESEYGKGSVFTVRIRQGFVSVKPIGAEVVKQLRDFRYVDCRVIRNARKECANLHDTHILAVDDVPVNLDVIKGMLKPYGMKVDCLGSGEQAVEAVRAERVRYDAIFMDHMMPGMDGTEAMKRIRAIGTDYARTVPIIVLTANVIVGNEKMFLDEGFQGFLGKPIDMHLLDAIVGRWLCRMPENGPDRDAPPFPVWRIQGLDLEQALARFGDNDQALLQALRSYAKHTPALLEQAKGVSVEGLAGYAIVVHGLKGSSYSVGANQIGDEAKELEHAAKAGDFASVMARNASFIASAERLIARLNEALAGLDADKPEKDAPDPQALERLRAACECYDMDGVDEALEELEAFHYASGQDLVLWLREQTDKMELRLIGEKLAAREAERDSP